MWKKHEWTAQMHVYNRRVEKNRYAFEIAMKSQFIESSEAKKGKQHTQQCW